MIRVENKKIRLCISNDLEPKPTKEAKKKKKKSSSEKKLSTPRIKPRIGKTAKSKSRLLNKIGKKLKNDSVTRPPTNKNSKIDDAFQLIKKQQALILPIPTAADAEPWSTKLPCSPFTEYEEEGYETDIPSSNTGESRINSPVDFITESTNLKNKLHDTGSESEECTKLELPLSPDYSEIPCITDSDSEERTRLPPSPILTEDLLCATFSPISSDSEEY